ncbi:MAG: hypothetical protein UT94_C0032G0001, partial [Candidatus Uhrbacteria bacterium GW2011_GWF2_40_263]
MTKTHSRGEAKYIRRQKALIRKSAKNKEEQERLIRELLNTLQP